MQGHQINARIKAKPMHRFFNVPGNVSGGMPGVPGLGLVPPAPVPLPVPVLLAAPGGPLPVAVAPVPPTAVPLAPAAAAVGQLKNGFATSVASATPPPHETAPAVGPSSPAGQAGQAPPQQQQQQQHQHHQQQQQQQQSHIPAQQPRFLYAVHPNPGAPYAGQPQLQLYAFPHPNSFYTPTVPVGNECLSDGELTREIDN